MVRGAVALARRLDVPPVVVAATVVGFGTSLPEMVVSIQATLTGFPDLILGNVVGSNIANVLLVGGASAVVYPMLHSDGELRRNVLLMSASLLAFTVFAATGEIGRVEGGLLLGAFAVMMAATARSTIQARRGSDPSTPLDWVLGIPSRMGTIAFFIVIGVAMLPLGARLLVTSAVEIARSFEVPEAVIGLTILAIGTSLPEVTTTVLAALEKRSDVAIGTIVGSNTFN
ncbi:MAG: sodium:calcium antiporter, partial [Longimicrobiales bacterium]|nr:sodium:calcium antiporter [Longimicrobiales bacterium]